MWYNMVQHSKRQPLFSPSPIPTKHTLPMTLTIRSPTPVPHLGAQNSKMRPCKRVNMGNTFLRICSQGKCTKLLVGPHLMTSLTHAGWTKDYIINFTDPFKFKEGVTCLSKDTKVSAAVALKPPEGRVPEG